jgi:uncharacterized membrane protein
MLEQAEQGLLLAVEWLRLVVEFVGASMIAAGIGTSLYALARQLIAKRWGDFDPVRLSFARYLAMGLEFQLAADVLSTAVSPSWDRIGKLAAIAVIRTGLNFFLMREMKHGGRSSDVGSR